MLPGQRPLVPVTRLPYEKCLKNAYRMAASGQLLVRKRSEVEIRNEIHAVELKLWPIVGSFRES